MIRYFVSFTILDTNGTGYGHCEIHRHEPIQSMADIAAITGLLRQQGHPNPIVLSFCPFDGEAADGQATR